MNVPATPELRLVEAIVDEATPDSIARYFRPPDQADGTSFSGRFFEQWSDTTQPNSFTPSDLLAVTALSVPIPPKASAMILSDSELAILLAALPADVQLSDLDESECDTVFNSMNALNARLRTIHGIGPTTASKLMAAKRPHLVPIWDTVVEAWLAPPSGGFWRLIYSTLRSSTVVRGELTLVQFVERLRRQLLEMRAVPADISQLRVIDIAIWMGHKDDK